MDAFRLMLPCTAIVCITLGTLPATTSGQSEDIFIPSASPAGDIGDPGNTVIQSSISGGFTARSLRWSGTVSSGANPFFFEEDIFASIRGPGGLGYTGPIGGEQGIFLGSTPIRGWYALPTTAEPAGDWTVETYTPGTLPSATNWSLIDTSVTIESALFPDTTPIRTREAVSADIAEADILWYRFRHGGGAFSASTAGSQIFELDGVIQTDDTYLALFDAGGSLVAENDDVGGGDFTSLIDLSGLESGNYWIAATGSTLGTRVDDGFIATTHDGVGTLDLVVIPAPATTLPVLAALLACHRRRWQ